MINPFALKMAMPPKFRCPKDMQWHLQKVFDGEYDIPLAGDAYRIIDLGANCGAFAIWAAHRWPGSEIFCYEPIPDTFEYLRQNVAKLKGQAESIRIFEAAITGTGPGYAQMSIGVNNCGEASLHNMQVDSGVFVTVPTLPPSSLTLAHILKLDVEGSELGILEQLVGVEQRTYWAILVEYHSPEIRLGIEQLLAPKYRLVKADVASPFRGTICYMNQKITG